MCTFLDLLLMVLVLQACFLYPIVSLSPIPLTCLLRKSTWGLQLLILTTGNPTLMAP